MKKFPILPAASYDPILKETKIGTIYNDGTVYFPNNVMIPNLLNNDNYTTAYDPELK